MNGKLAFTLALVGLAAAAHAEVRIRPSFTITIGNRPEPQPRVVVVEREAPRRVVYVERPAPRCHPPRAVYVEPRRECRPGRFVGFYGRGRDRHEGWSHEERDDHLSSRQDLSQSEREDRLASDETRRIDR